MLTATAHAEPSKPRLAASDGARTFQVMLGTSKDCVQWKAHILTLDEARAQFLGFEQRGYKDGKCFMPGLFIGKDRRQEAVTQIDLIAIDVDGLQSIEEGVALVQKFGTLAWVYSTFNHMQTVTQIKSDAYLKWARENKQPRTPSLAAMTAYLVAKKPAYSGVAFDAEATPVRKPDGYYYQVTHDPVQKFRVVLPLATPIVFDELRNEGGGLTSAETADVYGAIYEGIADAIGLKFDAALKTPQSLVYTPACAPERMEYAFGLEVPGPLLDWLERGWITLADLKNTELGGGSLTGGPFVLPKAGGFVVPLGQHSAALAALNERWSVIKHGAKTRYHNLRHDCTPEFMGKDPFSDWYAAAYYEVQNKEGRLEQRPLIPSWLGWTGRREYCGYGFFPAPAGHPDACPEGYYNAYRGFSVEPKRGSWKLLLGHVYRNVCQRNREYFRWLIAWLAQLVQRPHIKPGTHIVLKGKEGVGKSKLGEWMIRLIGLANAMPITSASRLTGRFNGHMEALLFGLVEEALWAGDKQAESALKALATADILDYERKGLDSTAGRNYVRLMFASNEAWVIPASSGGRRWFVLEVGDEHEKDYGYFAAIDDEMANGGLAAMLYDLQHTRLADQVNVRAAPVTPWLVEQRVHSQDARKKWLRDVLALGAVIYKNDIGNVEQVELEMADWTSVDREKIFASAAPFFGGKGRPPTRAEVGRFLCQTACEVDPRSASNFDPSIA
jgi:Family of unknown function (DUF5906)